MLPIMILVMIGTMEIGLAFKDYLTISYAAREGARVGALAGDSVDADCDIVTAVVDIIGPTGLDHLQRLEIYEADPITGAQVVANTNTWTYVGTDPYDCAGDWTIVETWPSTSRQVAFGATSVLDIIGVRALVTHTWITGMPPFSGSFTVDEAAITRIEPEAFE